MAGSHDLDGRTRTQHEVNWARIAFGLTAIAVGVVDLVWGRLDPDHQPLQAWGDNIPGAHVTGYAIGALLVVGGLAVVRRQTLRFGACAVGLAYVTFTIFWLPRLYWVPTILGATVSSMTGVLAGIGSQLIVVCAAAILFASAGPVAHRLTPVVRWVFGLCSIDFGLQHLTNIGRNVIYVPHWMPFGQAFWVAFTGAAFVLAGIAILSRTLDVVATRLLALMFFTFNVVTLVPGLIAEPRDQVNWGGNAYNLLAAASAWVLAEWLAALISPARARARSLHG